MSVAQANSEVAISERQKFWTLGVPEKAVHILNKDTTAQGLSRYASQSWVPILAGSDQCAH